MTLLCLASPNPSFPGSDYVSKNSSFYPSLLGKNKRKEKKTNIPLQYRLLDRPPCVSIQLHSIWNADRTSPHRPRGDCFPPKAPHQGDPKHRVSVDLCGIWHQSAGDIIHSVWPMPCLIQFLVHSLNSIP